MAFRAVHHFSHTSLKKRINLPFLFCIRPLWIFCFDDIICKCILTWFFNFFLSFQLHQLLIKHWTESRRCGYYLQALNQRWIYAAEITQAASFLHPWTRCWRPCYKIAVLKCPAALCRQAVCLWSRFVCICCVCVSNIWGNVSALHVVLVNMCFFYWLFLSLCVCLSLVADVPSPL